VAELARHITRNADYPAEVTLARQLAQQFLAALARDWDAQLESLAAHLDASAGKRARGLHA
jgi:hypothetical protein